MSRIVLVNCLIVLVCGCGKGLDEPPPATAGLPAVASLEPPPPIEPYPPGRWRLAQRAELERSLLWVSHILIRHADATDDGVSFDFAAWQMASSRPTRSKSEALRLATLLSEQAQRDPSRFAELATENSDDVTTADRGGSLGGMLALKFIRCPAVLDALAALEPGQVSRVVETLHGFHVFHRRPAPPPQLLSGQRIVIGHDAAPFLEVAARPGIEHRSPDEARALAMDVYERARSHAADFDQLVTEFSEHEDATRAGYLGTWWTNELNPRSRETETLESLAIGAIAPPIQTLFGYTVLKRIEPRPTAALAMERIELRYDPTLAPGEPNSAAATLAEARALIARLSKHPEDFPVEQARLSSSGVSRVEPGLEPPSVEAALERLRPGQIASEPVAIYTGYLVVRRGADATLPAKPSARFELPTPVDPDLFYLYSTTDGALLEAELERLGSSAATQLGLVEVQADALRALHRMGGKFAAASPDERMTLWLQLRSSVHALMTNGDGDAYDDLARQHFEQFMLGVD